MSQIVRKVTSPEVLRNDGVSVQFYVVTAQANQSNGEVTFVANKDMLVEKKVKFTTWSMHLLEDKFNTLTQFSELLVTRPWSTVIKALNIALDWPERQVAEAMIPYNIDDYALSLGMAYRTALGDDPKILMTALNNLLEPPLPEPVEPEQTEAVTVNEPESQNVSLSQATMTQPSTQTANSSGTTSGTPGSNLDVTPNSSGPSALLSSFTS